MSGISDALLHEIEHFFVAYNQGTGKKFEPRARVGPKKATRLIEEGMKKARRK